VDFEDGTPGTPGSFSYDTVTHGPLLGIMYRFYEYASSVSIFLSLMICKLCSPVYAWALNWNTCPVRGNIGNNPVRFNLLCILFPIIITHEITKITDHARSWFRSRRSHL
jgi:hypothetical protein